MTVLGWLEIVSTLVLVGGAAWPLGAFMSDVFEGRRTFLSPLMRPIERGLYALAGIDEKAEQTWLAYALSMTLFTGLCFGALYAILRLQDVLPLNPQGFPAVSPDLAFNIAISFITNANWQAYGGETTLSPFSQMVGLTSQNVLDSAVAIGIALALSRALQRNESTTVGNFWVDLTRATLYVPRNRCDPATPSRASFRRREQPTWPFVELGQDRRVACPKLFLRIVVDHSQRYDANALPGIP